MGTLAVSRVETIDRPVPSIADEVAAIARNELAPLAASHRQRRRLSGRGAPALRRGRRLAQPSPGRGAGRSALRHRVDGGDRRGLRRHRLHGVVPEHAGLVRRQFDQSEARVALRRRLCHGADSRRHRPVEPDEDLFRDREAQTERAARSTAAMSCAARCPGSPISGRTISSARSSSARTHPASS